MRNEIKLNLELFKRSPHLCLRCSAQRTHTHACTCIHTPTHPWSPLPCQHPSREIRRLETGQPWPMYIFMGLIWHHFSLLLEKEMYLIYTIPIWLVHRGGIHRESRPIVWASPLKHNLFCSSVCTCNFVHVCLHTVCQHAEQRAAEEKIKTSSHIPDLYSTLKQWQLCSSVWMGGWELYPADAVCVLNKLIIKTCLTDEKWVLGL